MPSDNESIRKKSMRQVKEHWFKAVELGRQPEVIELLQHENLVLEQTDYEHAFCLAAQNNRLDIAKWLQDLKKMPIKTLLQGLNNASENGYSDFMRWLILDKSVQPTINTLCCAAKNGHLENVKWLIFTFNVAPQDDQYSGLPSSALLSAASGGHLQVVEFLLTLKNVNPSYAQNIAFRIAVHNGEFEIVELLLADKRVDPADHENQAIVVASQNGHHKILKLLLADSRVNPSDCNNWAFRIAVQEGHLEIVKLLLTDSRIDLAAIRFNFKAPLEINPANQDYLKILKILLTDPGTHSDFLSLYFLIAASIGSLEMINLILIDKRINLDQYVINYAFAISAEFGHENVAKELLKFEDVNFSWDNNRCFIYAVKNNHTNIVKLLLADKRIKQIPKELCRVLLSGWKSPGNHPDSLEMAKLLLSTDRICKGTLLCSAAKDGNDELIIWLLKSIKDYPDITMIYAIASAIDGNQIETAKLLMADSRTNSAYLYQNSCNLLVEASKKGWLDIVNLLLTDKRINPAHNKFEAIKEAALNDHIQVLRVLINDTRIDSKQMSIEINNDDHKEEIQRAIKEANTFINGWSKLRFFSQLQLPLEVAHEIQKKVYDVYMK